MRSDVYIADGKPVALENLIGEGGEGKVFSIAALPGLAAKIYKGSIARDREDKIAAMVGSGLAAKSETISFPICVLREKNGRFAGFMMRLVQGHHPLHELYSPASRQQHFPKADYRFLVRSALNICKAVAQAHQAGCMIGDINHSGILISSKATAVLIDADSFQFVPDERRFLCLVGVPEYTPPELQGRSLRNVVRTTDHDAFGLAVVVFQILAMGRHPFSGRFSGGGEMPIERAIKEYRFAYSEIRNTQMSPPSGVCVLADFPKDTANAFERAFSPRFAQNRPKASEWVRLLETFENSLRQCSKNKLHHYSREATDCPWCRLERVYASTLFRVEDPPLQSFPKGKVNLAKGLIFDVDGYWASVNAVKLPKTVSYPMPSVPPPTKASGTVNLVRRERRNNQFRQFARFSSIGIGALVWALAPEIWFIAIGIAWFGWAKFSDSGNQSDRLSQDFASISQDISARIDKLQILHPVDEANETKAAIYDNVEEFRRLSTKFAQVETEYSKGRHKAQLDRFLEQHFLRKATIERVGSTDKAALISYGVETALDAKRKALQRVYGIGPVKSANIRAWVRRIEAGFKFNSDFTKQDHDEIGRKKSKIVSNQISLEKQLRANYSKFKNQAGKIKYWAQRPDEELIELLAELEQVIFDMQLLGVPIPDRPSIPPRSIPSVDVYRRNLRARRSSAATIANPGAQSTSASNVPNCPKCGSKMVRRIARKGQYRGSQFWGCSKFPRCRGIRPI